MAKPQNTGDDAPPFLGSWRRIYLFLLLYLLTLIVVLWAVSRYFTDPAQ